ncbi:MAG: hypothetical protein ACMG6E_09640 [Candidatus Roizmanbacteria bacterium]
MFQNSSTNTDSSSLHSQLGQTIKSFNTNNFLHNNSKAEFSATTKIMIGDIIKAKKLRKKSAHATQKSTGSNNINFEFLKQEYKQQEEL